MVTLHGIEFPDPTPERIDPVEGSPAGIEAFAEVLHGVCADFEELGDFAWTAGTRTMGLWLGADQEAYQETAASIREEANILQSGMRRVTRSATIHADELAELKTRRSDLVERLSRANSWRADLVAELRAMEAPLPEMNRVGYTDAARVLRGDYQEIVRDHATLMRDVRRNEQMMIDAFASNQSLVGIEEQADESNDLVNDALAKLGPTGFHLASPEAVREWWAELSDEERQALLVHSPAQLGQLDGLPAEVRDDANRVVLEEQLNVLGEKQDDGTISDHEAEVLDNARHVDDAIRQAEKYVDPLTGEHPPIQLWMFDAEKFGTDNGAVAISVGDLDTADNVAVRVPGITTDIDDASSLTREATNLYQSARVNGDGNSVASMMWLGYDAPAGIHDPATLTEHRAEDGGARLADDIDGLRASREDRAHMSVIGHSYGSTTMGRAAGDHGLDVDDMVYVGSPGGGYGNASDLNLDDGRVWSGRNSRDLVGALGDHGSVNPGLTGAGLGRDPAEDEFGATRFTAEDTERSWHRGIDAHSNYFNENSESLYNMGRIVDGDDGDVIEAQHVHDPVFGGPDDPEWGRVDIDTPSTGTVEYE